MIALTAAFDQQLLLADTCHQQSDKILFGHFVIALNAAFDQQLSLADEGYESMVQILLTYPLH